MADIEYTVGETAITVSFLGAQGPGVPAGGTAGQALVKSSSDDYDTEWAASAAPVDSVNGEIGAVVLDAADVGAAAASHSHTLSDITDAGTAAAADSGDFATAAQGGLADSAVQPGDLAAVATSGDYDDLTNKPTLGTAAATDSTAYATALQGSTADSATQPGDNANTLGSGAATDGHVLTADGAGGAAWEAVPAAPVASVNGETGAVVLDNTDVGAAATSHTHTESDIADLGSYVAQGDVVAIDVLTQEQYDALGTPTSTTLYIITA